MPPRLTCGHYYGEMVSRRCVADLILTETRYDPGVQLPRHCHEHAYFCLIRQGGYTEVYGSRERSCGPLTLAYHPPGEMHTQRFAGAQVRSFNVEVAPSWCDRLGAGLVLRESPAEFPGGPVASVAVRLYQEFRQPDTASPWAIEGLTLELLAAALRAATVVPGPRAPAWLLRVRDQLQEEFIDPPTLAQLAAGAGVHPVHLAGAFRR